jgi:hypothetical protein
MFQLPEFFAHNQSYNYKPDGQFRSSLEDLLVIQARDPFSGKPKQTRHIMLSHSASSALVADGCVERYTRG